MIRSLAAALAFLAVAAPMSADVTTATPFVIGVTLGDDASEPADRNGRKVSPDRFDGHRVAVPARTSPQPGAVLSMAADGQAPSWTEEKCIRYRKAWSDLLARRDKRGLGPDFLASHEAFLASGCTARHDVCPKSLEELEVANVLVIAAMNFGTASTFPPFACPKP